MINSKLMHLIGDELRDVFETSYYLEDTTDILHSNEHNKSPPNPNDYSSIGHPTT
jgi:hypothetical protein